MSTPKSERWTALVTAHTASFEEVIAIAEARPYRACDPVAMRAAASILASVADSARVGLSALRAEAADPDIGEGAYGSLGTWGRNGWEPRIEGMVTSAQFHASRIDALAVRRAA